jgi:hypothetical protein
MVGKPLTATLARPRRWPTQAVVWLEWGRSRRKLALLLGLKRSKRLGLSRWKPRFGVGQFRRLGWAVKHGTAVAVEGHEVSPPGPPATRTCFSSAKVRAARQPEVPKVAGSAAPVNISEYMAAIGRKGGQIGGNRRLKTMTKAQRSKIAAKATKARWKQVKRDR